MDIPESFDALISPEKLALLSLLKEVVPAKYFPVFRISFRTLLVTFYKAFLHRINEIQSLFS